MEKPKTSGQCPDWVQISDSSNQHLAEMLRFGSDNYERQTNWFLHHRDTGFRNLAAVLTAEFTVTSLYFAKAGLPQMVTAAFFFS
jgi:hypothetical protein